MTKQLYAKAALALLLPAFALSAQAADCDANFASSGNILTGKTYKTFARLANVSADTAYQGAYLSIAKQGFMIQHSDRSARVIFALNNSSTPGRPAPLNATVEQSPGGAVISLSFAIPAGAFSPESSIRDEFCKIVDAAVATQADAAQLAPAQPPERPAPGPGRLCLAGACLGMSLDEAAQLNLKPRSTKLAPISSFVSTKERGGYYGLDANGKLVSITSLAVDQVWIKQFAQTIHTMCVVPSNVSADISASDGAPISLVFGLQKRNGKVEYVLSSISRLLPGNMSASERKNFENEVRQRYGRAFVETRDIGKSIMASNGQLSEASVMLNPASLELRGPGYPEIASKLIEQPGCSNRVRLD